MDTGRTVRFEPQCALIPEVAYSALPRLETRTYAVPLPIHWGSRATTNVRSSNATDTIHEMDASKASPEDSPRRLVVRVPSLTLKKRSHAPHIDPSEVKSCLRRTPSFERGLPPPIHIKSSELSPPTPNESLPSNSPTPSSSALWSLPLPHRSPLSSSTSSPSTPRSARRRNSLPTSMPPQHTLPLRECCKDCLPCTERALSADSATYTESWTPGARRKKLLDDEEERRDHNAYISTTRHYYPRIRLDELEKLWPDPVQEAAIELEESIDELRPLPTSSVMSASTSASPSRNPSLTAKQPDARFPPLISVVERRFHPRRTVSESDVPSVLGRGPPPNRNQNARGGGRMFSWTKGPASIVKGLGGSGMIAVG